MVTLYFPEVHCTSVKYTGWASVRWCWLAKPMQDDLAQVRRMKPEQTNAVSIAEVALRSPAVCGEGCLLEPVRAFALPTRPSQA